MSLVFLEVLAPAHLEDRHLVAASVRHDGRLDLRARDQRGADLHLVAVADEQDFFERDRGADVGHQRFNAYLRAGFDAILLAA